MKEQLTSQELHAHVKNGTFRLAFVGMSNCGKSYRSRVLHRELDFLWYHVDGQIMEALGFSDMNEISEWMGYPTSPRYPEREARYLEQENHFTQQAAMNTHGQNLVFDTTGSVVHLTEETKQILHDNCLIVHIDVGDIRLDEMIAKFFSDPKPVAWCGHFDQQPGESETEALKRCYPELLHWRLEAYRTLAHVNLPLEQLFDTSGEKTLTTIAQGLSG